MTQQTHLPADVMDKLAAPFELWQHEYRKQGRNDDVTGYLSYVGIEHAIARMNQVFGCRWSWTIIGYQVSGDPAKPCVVCHGRISYTDNLGSEFHRDGIGGAQWASTADDLDKLVKTAMADAFKKATHQFGMAGYLWDKGLADQIAVQLLREEGKQWDAKYRAKTPRKGNADAAVILKDLATGTGSAGATASGPAAQNGGTQAAPAAATPPAAAPGAGVAAPAAGAHGSEEWKAASNKFRGRVGDLAGSADDGAKVYAVQKLLAAVFKALTPVPTSTTQLTAGQLDHLVTTLANEQWASWFGQHLAAAPKAAA